MPFFVYIFQYESENVMKNYTWSMEMHVPTTFMYSLRAYAKLVVVFPLADSSWYKLKSKQPCSSCSKLRENLSEHQKHDDKKLIRILGWGVPASNYTIKKFNKTKCWIVNTTNVKKYKQNYKQIISNWNINWVQLNIWIRWGKKNTSNLYCSLQP